MGAKRKRVLLAESGMTAFEMETVESCRSLGIVPADRFRPVPLAARSAMSWRIARKLVSGGTSTASTRACARVLQVLSGANPSIAPKKAPDLSGAFA